MTAKPKLTWNVPRWAYVPQLWAQLDQILNRASRIRIILGALIASAVLVAGFRRAVPQLVLPNLRPVVLTLLAIILLFVAQFAILTLIAPTVTIRPDKILVQHGQSATIIDPKDVSAVPYRPCKSSVSTNVIFIANTNDRNVASPAEFSRGHKLPWPRFSA